jgi:hypothetical protein
MTMRITIQGEADVITNLKELKMRMQKKIINGAARAALKPIVADARSRVPKESGQLKKSLGVIYGGMNRQRNAFKFRVGARKGFQHDAINLFGQPYVADPRRYAPPLEFGHDVVLRGKIVYHIAPVGFMRGAFEAGRAKLVTDFAREVRARLDATMAANAAVE